MTELYRLTQEIHHSLILYIFWQCTTVLIHDTVMLSKLSINATINNKKQSKNSTKNENNNNILNYKTFCPHHHHHHQNSILIKIEKFSHLSITFLTPCCWNFIMNMHIFFCIDTTMFCIFIYFLFFFRCLIVLYYYSILIFLRILK